MTVVSIDPLHHVLEPEVGFLDGTVDGIEACGHGASPHLGESNKLRRPRLGCTLNDQRRLVRRAGLASLKGLGFSRITSVAGLVVGKPKNTGLPISPAAGQFGH